MNGVHLLTHVEIENCLNTAESGSAVSSASREGIGVCPVTELVELCERYKKHDPVSLDLLRQRCETLQDGTIECSTGLAVVIPFDQQRLLDSLFESDDQSRVTDLWPPGRDRYTRCIHSVRRLLLRATEQIWWDSSLYDCAEEAYAHQVRESRYA